MFEWPLYFPLIFVIAIDSHKPAINLRLAVSPMPQQSN
jgi:hypothetical protein